MYVIAEIGSNYNSIEDCVLSIELAKKAGADAVKFQHFTEKELYGYGDRVVTPESWLYGLHKVAKQISMDFSCTFFEPNKLDKYLDILDFIKIASSNMMDTRLLDIAKGSAAKTFISTGGHELYEVQKVFDYFPGASFMYCESVYPSHVNDYSKMTQFYFEGISDHSLSVFPSYPTSTRYAEKHVNFLDLRDKPDSPHSLNFHEFEKYCRHVKNQCKYKPLLSPEELDMRLKYNVRLTAKEFIPEGHKLTWYNVGIFRGS
jgi:N-acetylneuraminate synthase